MRLLLLLGLLLASSTAWSEPSRPPVIDMHIHAWTLGSAAGATSCPGSRRSYYPPIDPRAPFDLSKIVACTQPFRAPLSDERLMRDSLAMLRRYNIRHAVTSGDPPEVTRGRAAAPAKIFAGFGLGKATPPSVEELRR